MIPRKALNGVSISYALCLRLLRYISDSEFSRVCPNWIISNKEKNKEEKEEEEEK